jgi:hypothetical protein
MDRGQTAPTGQISAATISERACPSGASRTDRAVFHGGGVHVQDRGRACLKSVRPFSEGRAQPNGC